VNRFPGDTSGCSRFNLFCHKVSRLLSYTGIRLPVAILLPVVLAVTHVPAVNADQASEKAAELKQIRTRISGLKKELDAIRGKRDALQAQLEKTETEIGAITVELHQLERETDALRNQLQTLASRKQARLDDLRRMQVALASDIRTAYAMGQQEQVKLLLNQEDPAAVGRMLSYQRYLTSARSVRLDDLRVLLEELAGLESVVGEKQADLEELRAGKQDIVRRLDREQARRKSVLAGLQSGLEKKSGQLTALQGDEQRLQQLLLSLQQALRDIPPTAGEYQSLRSVKGSLIWPVTGRIQTSYGARLGKGKPDSRGILVSAPEGTEVHAIHKGRVAFADWLRGFGLLLIIDHGNGYMSLYGHNRGLLRQVGDWVENGEVVAIVGNSGGEQRAGLYLELRKDGRPFNPGPWFAGNPSARRAGR
jgi:septal ring factor EnvC (AmiA/AmiB activator)